MRRRIFSLIVQREEEVELALSVSRYHLTNFHRERGQLHQASANTVNILCVRHTGDKCVLTALEKSPSEM